MAVPTRFVEAGSHRGARDIHREATRQKVIALLDEVTLVDPEREKVERLAQEYRSSGVSARAVVGRGESAVEREDEGVVALATVDDLDASSVLAAANPRRDTLVQIVGRGPGPAQRPCPTFGLNLPCLRDRDTERASATALLRDLADITGHTRTSSSVHREHGPSAMALARTRRQTSAETVRSFAQLERTRDRSALHGFTWNGSQLPLLIEQRADRQIARGASQAMDLVSGDRPTAVALLSKSDRVDFYVIERGRLSLWVPVAKSAPVPQLAPVQRSTPRVSGRTVAVGLAVGAVAALALAATAGTAAVAAPAAVPAAFTD